MAYKAFNWVLIEVKSQEYSCFNVDESKFDIYII
jgi:hypothetical protein